MERVFLFNNQSKKDNKMTISINDLVRDQKVSVYTSLKSEKIETISEVYFGSNSSLLKIKMDSGEIYLAVDILEIK
jgi:DNA-directed RNA polymerase alpha subunit